MLANENLKNAKKCELNGQEIQHVDHADFLGVSSICSELTKRRCLSRLTQTRHQIQKSQTFGVNAKMLAEAELMAVSQSLVISAATHGMWLVPRDEDVLKNRRS